MRAAFATQTLASRLSAPLDRASAHLARARGWRRLLLALAAGAATALAFAPFYFLPLMAAGYSALIFLLDGAAAERRKRFAAFVTGWFFGFGFFLVGLYWMAFSFFVQAEEFAWMAPFAVTGMPAFLALFFGGASALAVSLWRPGPARVLIFTVSLMAFEYARGHILTGLPWNLPGQALAGTAAGAQSAAIYGVYGLSLVAMLVAAAPALWKDGALKGLALAAGASALLFAGGAARLAMPGPGVHDDVVVRVVQPNIPQREKIDWDLWGRNFAKHVELSKGAAPKDAKLFILWPENAASLVTEVDGAMAYLTKELPPQSTLVAGSVRRETDAAGTERYYNSVAVIPDARPGRIVIAYYDKHHLVPFGEYLPFAAFLRAVGLAQLAPYDDGFSFGAGPRTMNAGGPSFAPLICYEAIFPGEIYPEGERPEWLVAVTNDAWFGDTSGPRQHLDQARLRSIETGLPMARSANTGISALIDSRGRYAERIPLYRTGVFDAALPRAAAPTIYARTGDSLFLLMMFLCTVCGFVPLRRARTRS
ncbi:MAG: apolipoprotein N-acyltransferase [Pseudomonadota bacterium]|nr:apolipoprotein N-acyltransferase [Pseudomonadota bacterium]